MANVIVLPIRKTKEYRQRRETRSLDYRKLYRFDEINVQWMANHFLGTTEGTRGGALTNKQKMQVYLRYMADPGFQIGVGEDVGVDQSTVSKIIKEVVIEIVKKAEVWIKFPTNLAEINTAKAAWLTKFKIPSIIGALDCTHIRISKPSTANHGDEYINRKKFASINVQATCNVQEEFTSVDAKWPGSVHDSRIWNNSSTFSHMSTRTTDTMVIADSGYGISPWVLTPYKNPTTPQERHFNHIYAKERVIIERCFGQLKRRFPILQYKMRLALNKVSETIISCFVLHNVAKYLGDNYEDFPEIPDDDEEEPEPPIITNDQRIRQAGKIRRTQICQILYQRR